MPPLVSPINNNPNYFKQPNPQGLAEAYLRDIHRNVHLKKFSFLCTITGRHRVGKSLSAIGFADILDPTFITCLEKRVVYTPEDFSEAVQKLDEDGVIGGAIVWDEANLGLSSRDWYTLANKHINFTIQAFGYLRPMVFFVTQDVTFIDSQPRKLFHAFYEVERTSNKFAKIRCFKIAINKRTGKMYYSYPRFHGVYKGGRGATIIMKPLKMMLPPKKLIDRYETHSKTMKRRLLKQNADIIQAMRDRSKDVTRDRLSEDEIIQHCLGEKDNPLFINRDGKYRVNIISEEFKIPQRYAKRIKIICDVKLKELREEGIENGATVNR